VTGIAVEPSRSYEQDPPALVRPVLLYSGTCRFCCWAARVVAALDRREQLAILPLADDAADPLFANVAQDERAETWWLVLHDGTPVRGDRGGGIALLVELRLLAPLGRALSALRLSGLVDAADRLVSRHRARLGRFVPERPPLRRYP
jgi:predicted DCC family thiol-disulfide oxidoreductase YuxK